MTKQTNILAQTAKTPNAPQLLTRTQLLSVTGGGSHMSLRPLPIGSSANNG